MTLSSIERAYYTAKKRHALGFIQRLTDRYNSAVACHARDIRECDEKLEDISRGAFIGLLPIDPVVAQNAEAATSNPDAPPFLKNAS